MQPFFHETRVKRIDSTVFCSGYEKRREPVDHSEVILGTTNISSISAPVTYKISIETGGFKSELMCVSIRVFANDYFVLWLKGGKII